MSDGVKQTASDKDRCGHGRLVSHSVCLCLCVSLSVCICVSVCVSQCACLYVVSLFFCLSLSV